MCPLQRVRVVSDVSAVVVSALVADRSDGGGDVVQVVAVGVSVAIVGDLYLFCFLGGRLVAVVCFWLLLLIVVTFRLLSLFF